MFRVKNYYLFHSVTASIKLSIFTQPASRSALREITEGQSEIEKSIWRRLAWMHLQAALMTADSFLQLLVQSHSNLFFHGALSKRAALFCRACSIKCAVCLSGHSMIPS